MELIDVLSADRLKLGSRLVSENRYCELSPGESALTTRQDDAIKYHNCSSSTPAMLEPVLLRYGASGSRDWMHYRELC